MGVGTIIGVGCLAFAVTLFFQAVWQTAFNRIRTQRVFDVIEDLANRDVDLIRSMTKASVDEKRRLIERVYYLKNKAKRRHETMERSARKEGDVEGRYYVNANGYGIEPSKMLGCSVGSMLFSTGVLALSPWPVSYPFSMAMLLAFLLSIPSGYVLARNSGVQTERVSPSLRDFLYERDTLVIEKFIEKMEAYRASDGKYKMSIDEPDGRHYRVLSSPALPKDLLDLEMVEMEGIPERMILLFDLAVVLREMLKVVSRLQRDPLYHTVGKAKFHVFFEMLHQKNRSHGDSYYLLQTQNLWKNYPEDMQEALTLVRRLREILDGWASSGQTASPSNAEVAIDTPEQTKSEHVEVRRVRHALALIEQIERREDVDPEVRQMAQAVKQEVETLRGRIQQQQEDRRTHWEEMQDFSTIKSVRDALGLGVEEEAEWVKKQSE